MNPKVLKNIIIAAVLAAGPSAAFAQSQSSTPPVSAAELETLYTSTL